MAVTGQPQKMQMMQPGQMGQTLAVGGVPPSIAYLASLDQLIVKQKKQLMGFQMGFQMENKYEVFNNMRQQVFYVAEESETCERTCCTPYRGFQLHVLDNSSQEVARFSREFACCRGCCWCADGDCGCRVDVESPVGNHIGYVKQRTSKCAPHYSIHDKQNKHLFTIWGPCCICQDVCCPDDVEFPVTTPDLQRRVGCVAKQWGGCSVENITDADTFSVTFLQDMAVEAKLLLFGACFMVDYLNLQESGGGGGGGA